MRHVFIPAALLLSLAALALAQGNCSIGIVAGTWGYIETGTLYLPTGEVSYASVGRFTVDPDGSYTAVRTASRGGTILPGTFKGTMIVNSDCTGTLTQYTYDQSGNVASTTVKAFVFVNNTTEAYAIVTSIVQSGTSVPAVLTNTAKKLFPARM